MTACRCRLPVCLCNLARVLHDQARWQMPTAGALERMQDDAEALKTQRVYEGLGISPGERDHLARRAVDFVRNARRCPKCKRRDLDIRNNPRY